MDRSEPVLRTNRVDALDEMQRDPGMVLGTLGGRSCACGTEGRGDGEKDDNASSH